MAGPAYSKNMLLQNTGASSNAYYGDSPDNYRVANGDYTLQCIYGGQASLSPIIMSRQNTDLYRTLKLSCVATEVEVG